MQKRWIIVDYGSRCTVHDERDPAVDDIQFDRNARADSRTFDLQEVRMVIAINCKMRLKKKFHVVYRFDLRRDFLVFGL